ncbi:uncharacterized protein N7515_007812 [Penicillium bovifimosum]|uniref:Methyltransferase domain-containing protein n=1 Tax=Penicillium bovifimosum TaxID=126998 RepID=A0A9W9KWX0_9EURO|nr:uncharacterized protein N7515_007812 [Penicillium bovifimosum]KAJ5123987.1 hypothetical protein N7515_007812 [Penicillium bovifimosum]
MYQTLRSDEYLIPPMTNSSKVTMLVGDSPTHILDIGTGKGTWAIDVADMFLATTVRGVDLFPPPVNWVPPNCVLEVDYVLREWIWILRSGIWSTKDVMS